MKVKNIDKFIPRAIIETLHMRKATKCCRERHADSTSVVVSSHLTSAQALPASRSRDCRTNRSLSSTRDPLLASQCHE